jgi:hypothetical protein
MQQLEYNNQVAVIMYLKVKYPHVIYNADCGGIRTTWGQAVRAKAAGHKKGWPDIFIAEARKGFHGLFIEMKAPATKWSKKGSSSAEQKQLQKDLTKRGYKSAICYGDLEAIKVIDEYFK